MNAYFDFLEGNSSVVTVSGGSDTAMRRVYSFMNGAIKYHDKQAEYSDEYKYGFGDNFVNFYDRKTNSLPIGLIPRLCSLIKGQFPDITIGLSPRIRSMFTPPVHLSNEDILKYADTLNIHDRKSGHAMSLYDHQLKLIYEAMNHRRGSLKACTSAGKSLAMYVMTRYLNEVEHRKVLIVVPNQGLVLQLYNNFYDDYGWDDAGNTCTLIYSDSKDKVTAAKKKKLAELNMGEQAMLKPVTISTWQSLQHKEPEFFKSFQAVIVDEAHGTRGIKLRTILDLCINADNFKIGVSGTLPDDGLDAGYIESSLGKKYDIVNLNELVEKGLLTPVKVVALFVPYPVDCRPMICYSKFDEEYSIVTGNRSRLDIMDMLIGSGKITTSQNTVILFRNITPLETMLSYLSETHPEFKYHVIKGEIKASERESIRNMMEDSSGNILIGTYGCLQAGMNIKNLDNLVFGDPGKSMYMICQSIGRIVRKNFGKEVATCYDIVDDASYLVHGRKRGNYMRQNCMVRHFGERMKYYENDHIPVTTVDLAGIVDADIKIDDIKKKRKEKADRKGKKPNKMKGYRRQF